MANSENKLHWYFGPGLVNQEFGPNDANFEILDADINSLVRESIQNSMDACDDPSIPVRITYRIRSLKPRDYPNLFGQLLQAVDRCLNYWGERATDRLGPMHDYLVSVSHANRITYIEVSDENTTGMTYREGDNTTSFYGFLHSSGASNKSSSNAGGSFGIGKAAYFALSRIRTLFVSTLNQEGEDTFQGIAKLCTHCDEVGNSLAPTGFYGIDEANPVTDPADIPYRFSRKGNPGTTFCIMGYDSDNDIDATYAEMRRAVLMNFWLAVYNGHLEVSIGDPQDSSHYHVDITAENIAELMLDDYPDIADNGRKGNINPRPYFEAYTALMLPKGKQASTITNSSHHLFEEELPKLGLCRFFLFKHPDGRSQISYFRMPEMMVYRKRQGSSNNFFGVFFCNNKQGDELLRRLESVAHDEWEPKHWKPDDKEGRAEARAVTNELKDFINRCVESAFATRSQQTIDIYGLDRYLYIPTASESDSDLSQSPEGDPIGGETDVESSPKSDFKGIRQDLSGHPSSSTGIIGKPRQSSSGKRDGGPLCGGKGRSKHASKSTNAHMPGTTPGYSESSDEESGAFAQLLDVRYRALAQKEQGVMYHYLRIESPEDIPNAFIEVKIGCENGPDEPLNIVSASPGQPYKNRVSNISLKKGLNTVKLQFVDNIKHTVSLTAYYETK
jgi:hypothetical protein